jgi:hypothetical protein
MARDSRGVSRPNMFEVLKDEDGNTYTPTHRVGDRTHFKVNGRGVVTSSNRDPESLRMKAIHEGILPRSSSPRFFGL